MRLARFLSGVLTSRRAWDAGIESPEEAVERIHLYIMLAISGLASRKWLARVKARTKSEVYQRCGAASHLASSIIHATIANHDASLTLCNY